MPPIKQLSLRFVAIATAISMGPPAAAQERACPYIRCFLSIQHDRGVVQGAAATPVAEFGAFAPRIDLLANGSDSTRRYYQAFRAAYNRGSAFHLVGAAAFVAGAIVVFVHPNENFHPTANVTTGTGISLGGLLMSVFGMVSHHQAQLDLERSMAFYNQALPDGP
jgi:hypothetical protein